MDQSPIAEILDRAVAGQRLGPTKGSRCWSRTIWPRWAARPTPSPAACIPSRTAPTTSTATSTTRTSAPAAAASARSRASRATRTATSSSRDELYRKIEETIALGGDQILLQGGMHPGVEASSGTKQLLRDIKRRFPQINVHGFSPPEIDHIAKVSGLPIREVLRAAEGGGPGQPARRRGGNPRRSRPPRGQPVQGLGRRLAGGLPRVARAGRTRLGHHDVRPRRNAGRADRTPGAIAPIAGRDGRIHRLYLLDVSARATRSWPTCPRPGRSSTSRRWPSAGCTSTTSPTFRPVGSRRGWRSASWPCASGPTTWAA